jgi:hypothetical protein
MNNVVTINRGKLPSAYTDGQKTGSFRDQMTFFGGVALWMVVPKLVYAAYGGPISFSVFLGLGVIGTILGVMMYRYFPPKRLSVVTIDTMPEIARTQEPARKQAA